MRRSGETSPLIGVGEGSHSRGRLDMDDIAARSHILWGEYRGLVWDDLIIFASCSATLSSRHG